MVYGFNPIAIAPICPISMDTGLGIILLVERTN
jgi:hypothetical protein